MVLVTSSTTFTSLGYIKENMWTKHQKLGKIKKIKKINFFKHVWPGYKSVNLDKGFLSHPDKIVDNKNAIEDKNNMKKI